MKGFTEEQIHQLAWETTISMTDHMKKIGKYSLVDLSRVVCVLFIRNLEKTGEMLGEDDYVIKICEAIIKMKKEEI